MKTLQTMASLKVIASKWAAQRTGTSPYTYMIQPLPGSRTTQIRQAGVSLFLRGSNVGKTYYLFCGHEAYLVLAFKIMHDKRYDMKSASSSVYSIANLLKPFRLREAFGRSHRTPHVEFIQVHCTETSALHKA